MKFTQVFLVSIVLAFSTSSFAQTYCNPSFSSGCAFSNYITQVSVGGMTNNTTGCTVWNYTSVNPQPSIVAGDTIAMTVKVGGWDGIAIYIDLNNDGDLSDTNEFIYSRYIAQFASTYNFTFVLPANTPAGNHRLRVNCGNGGSVGGGNPCVSTGYGNHHDYNLEITNNCQSDSNLTVSNITSSSADFTWAPRNGGTYEYILDTNSGAPAGAGTVTTATSFSATGLTSGTHYYFHIRTSCGSGIYSPWGEIDFVACDLPSSQISQSGNVKLCDGDTLTLSVPFNINNNYQWFRNSTAIPGETNSTLDIFLFPAKYYAEVETFPGCKSTSDFARITIHNNPAPPVLNVNGIFLSTSGFPTYEWYLNGGLIAGATDSIYTALANGSYHVRGYDTNSCVGISLPVAVTTVGLNDFESTELAIYPNPSNGIINIDFSVLGEYDLMVQNLLGETIFYERFEAISSKSIDLSDQVPGIYILSVQNLDRRIVRKILLE